MSKRIGPVAPRSVTPSRRRGLTILFNWGVWLLLVVQLFAQVFCIFWPTVETRFFAAFGQRPSKELQTLPDRNNEPFADRVVACRRHAQRYVPEQLSKLLRMSPQPPKGLSSNGIDGYRVLARDSLEFDAGTIPAYAHQCSLLAATLPRVLDLCAELGYSNVSRDVLRVVDGRESRVVTVLPETLPLLMIPFSDLSPIMRVVVPGLDGSSCVFQLGTNMYAYSDGVERVPHLIGTPRVYREQKTEEWLGYRGGKWRNGWYEDPVVGDKWHSAMLISTADFAVPTYEFDLRSDSPLPKRLCDSRSLPCDLDEQWSAWGPQLQIVVRPLWANLISISNGLGRGIGLYEAGTAQIVTSVYSLDKLVSSVSLVVIVVRWAVAMAVLNRPGRDYWLFWTAGGYYDGNQIALSESWFVMYPAIAETVMIVFSLLNLVVKLVRRRASDALFGPTLLALTLLHYFRYEITALRWVTATGRVATVVAANQIDTASLWDFLSTDLAFRVNGRVVPVFALKVFVLGANLLSLAWRSRSVSSSANRGESRVESALAITVGENGGLGLSRVYDEGRVLPYELTRAGYVALPTSGRSLVVLSIGHWLWFLVASPVVGYFSWHTMLFVRVVVYDGEMNDRDESVARVAERPMVACVGDERFAGVRPRSAASSLAG